MALHPTRKVLKREVHRCESKRSKWQEDEEAILGVHLMVSPNNEWVV